MCTFNSSFSEFGQSHGLSATSGSVKESNVFYSTAHSLWRAPQIPYIVNKSSVHHLPSHQVCFEMGHHHLKACHSLIMLPSTELLTITCPSATDTSTFCVSGLWRKGHYQTHYGSLSTNLRPNMQPSLQGAFISVFQMVRTLSVHQDISILFVFKAAETYSGSFPTALVPSTTQDHQWGAILRERGQQAI